MNGKDKMLSEKELEKMKMLYPGKTELELNEIVKKSSCNSSKILKEDVIIILVIVGLGFIVSIGLVFKYISNSIELWQLLVMLFVTYALSLEVGILIFSLKYEERLK